MPYALYPILFGLILFFTHILSDRIHFSHKNRIVSFSVGTAITYVFLYLLPEVVRGTYLVFVFMLIGLIIVRMVEIHVHRHKSRKIFKRESRETHSIIFFLYHFLIGIVLFEFSTTDLANGLLFFFPVFLHTAVSSVSFSEIHRSVKEVYAAKILLSASTLFGVIVALLFDIIPVAFDVMLGIVAGSMLYIVVRDSMPNEERAKPGYFLMGVLIYVIIIEMVIVVLG
jgi:zinc transporter ZupT